MGRGPYSHLTTLYKHKFVKRIENLIIGSTSFVVPKGDMRYNIAYPILKQLLDSFSWTPQGLEVPECLMED